MARQEPRSHLKARAHFPIDDLVVERRRPPTSIGLDALERAIRYFQYAEGMLRRTLAGLEPTRSAEDALVVAKQVVAKEWSHFTNHDVGRERGFRWFRGEDAENKRRRDNALNVLIDAKAIRQDLVQTGRGAIQKWAVNPDLGEKSVIFRPNQPAVTRAQDWVRVGRELFARYLRKLDRSSGHSSPHPPRREKESMRLAVS